MASLRQLCGGKYVARIRKWDGIKERELKPVPLETYSELEATIRLDEVNRMEKYIKDGNEIIFPWQNKDGTLKIKKHTLKEMVSEYLDYLDANGRKKTTIERAVYCLNNFMKSTGMNTPIDEINTEMVEYFKRYFKGKLTDNGININLTRIKAFLNWCFEVKEIIARVPRVTKIKVPAKVPSYLTANDLDKILKLNWLSLFYKDVFRMYWETGVRLREPFNGRIDRGWLIVDASHSKTGIERVINLKTYHVDTIEEIQKRAIESRSMFKTKTDHYSRIFKKVAVAIGRQNLSLHNLRDTFAVMRYLETRDIYLVSKELGHSSVKVTEKYAMFDLRRLELDFPSLASRYCNSNIKNTGFRDTVFGTKLTNPTVFSSRN